MLAEKAKRQLSEGTWQQQEKEKIEAYLKVATKSGDAASAARQQIAKVNSPYIRSVDAFGEKSVRLQHSLAGLADSRIIKWWDKLYWNYLRYGFTQERLIAKDRFGNKLTVTWKFQKGREEQRRMYREDANKKHLTYGSLATDGRLWERWMRGHRGDPPSIAEEEHARDYKKQYFGAMVLEEEEVEDALMHIMAHMNRSQQTFQELEDDQVYGGAHRPTEPLRQAEHHPEKEHAAKAQAGATWTLGFVCGDLFYNNEGGRGDAHGARARVSQHDVAGA
ncbi:hypothetical protein TraAM80_08295 [Trypanosoma rangeli]|uniref:Uncharacterized protein n=1 Tax=Trypanosoma rangeli TaxID=5698 RepID=A0A3R7MAW6_TRYRA|nr:uncharacterized protein TraAM80_08295 [Trypanosoma rangeli]RNE99310.1 hypothetical protein TraAM80_08295 [Trypanosoma rangeli]|eukprot:RNE99310.1 hypothetical protein TraAM80_08295 [Trypanosoma rangeli]